MGHYASEMSSTWGPSIERTERIMRLRKKIGLLDIGDFKVKQIVLLYNLFNSASDLSDKEIEELEKAYYVVAITQRRRDAGITT